MIAAALRLARSPRHRLLLGAGVAAALLALLSAPGGLAPTSARAALAVAAVAAAPALLRRRARPAAVAPLRVIAREPLGRDAGVAIVEADGRRLLVGFGHHGVRALAAPSPEEPRP